MAEIEQNVRLPPIVAEFLQAWLCLAEESKCVLRLVLIAMRYAEVDEAVSCSSVVSAQSEDRQSLLQVGSGLIRPPLLAVEDAKPLQRPRLSALIQSAKQLEGLIKVGSSFVELAPL
jgi:hypothetical protein